MLARLSVGRLIRLILGMTALIAVGVSGAVVMASWRRLDDSAQVLRAAEASRQLYLAFANMRSTRTAVRGAWLDPAPLGGEFKGYLERLDAAEMPALQASMRLLEDVPFAGKQTLLPEFRSAVAAYAGLRREFWQGVAQPAAQRRAELAAENTAASSVLLDRLDVLSRRVWQASQGLDSAVDRMMDVKQLAWSMRDVAGDLSLMISNGLAKPLPAGSRTMFDARQGALDEYRQQMTKRADGGGYPPAITGAIGAVQAQLFDPAYVATRERMIAAVLARGKAEMDGAEWPQYSVPRLSSLGQVASAALDAAVELAEKARQRSMLLFGACAGVLSSTALLLGLGLWVVGARVIRPLHALRDAMLRVAGGELEVEPPFAERRDEIGALAGALVVFRENAQQGRRLEAEQTLERLMKERRGERLAGLVAGFQAEASGLAEQLLESASALEGTAKAMECTASAADQQTATLAAAASQASKGVQTVAAAAGQLSGAIGAISQNVAQSAAMTEGAVDQARRTNAIVATLSERAQRIGAVVELISAIASQTNLLALNATIEAARAGDAGRGFAVVAAEVKLLAKQTAQATEDIGGQVEQIRRSSEEAVEAIRAITGMIEAISGISTDIAGSVTQQGSATDEITRNMDQTAVATQAMTSTVAGVSRAANDTGLAAGHVLGAAGAVSEQAERLSREVERFTREVRAA